MYLYIYYMEVKDIFKSISKLNFDEKRKLINSLKNQLFINNLDEYRTEHTGDRPVCPKCGSNHIIKNGSQKDVQKFRCKGCGKSFGLHTGTSIHYLHFKDEWTRFIELTLESKSIRDICNEMSHSIQTIFNWRHKLLVSINEVFKKYFKGVVEMDDMYIRFNQKGRRSNYIKREGVLRKRGISREQVSVLFTLDRYKTIDMKLLRVSKVNRLSIKRILDEGLINRLNLNNVIVTDYCKSYNDIFDGITHEKLNMSKREKVRGNYHLNTLNNQCGEFKDWIKYKFCTVSTKYLQNYLNLFQMIFFVLKNSNDKLNDLIKFSLKDGGTFKKFHQMEMKYQEFLTY